MSRGVHRERQVRKLLEEEGWVVIRTAGSLGCIDLVANRAGDRTRYIQVKSDALYPFKNFGPKDRAELLAAALQAGAEAQLAWWPPRGKLVWLEPDQWPQGKEAA